MTRSRPSAWDDSSGMTNSVQHVFVVDPALACAVRDLHLDKVALSVSPVKAVSRAQFAAE
jgi:hypothetical protein